MAASTRSSKGRQEISRQRRAGLSNRLLILQTSHRLRGEGAAREAGASEKRLQLVNTCLGNLPREFVRPHQCESDSQHVGGDASQDPQHIVRVLRLGATPAFRNSLGELVAL